MAGVVTVEQGVNVSSFSEQEKITIYPDLLLAEVVTWDESVVDPEGGRGDVRFPPPLEISPRCVKSLKNS